MVSDRPACLWRIVTSLGVYEALEKSQWPGAQGIGWDRQETAKGRDCAVWLQLVLSSAPLPSVGLWSTEGPPCGTLLVRESLGARVMPLMPEPW